ncbi:hypothetical protein A8B98_03620 [Hymenobacter sp. UV11]|nr:hypothetical protein A8B98_03620 [Hymenobacter sp. UV11]
MLVGDTLWLETNFSDSLLDLNSGKRYRIQPQDMSLETVFAIHELHGLGQKTTGLASTFRIVERIGQAAAGGEYTGLFTTIYDGHSYRAKFGLIPTKRGFTSISLLLLPPGGAKGFGRFIPFLTFPPDAQGREQKAVLDNMYLIINEGKANNYDLYRQQFTIDPETTGTDVPPASLIYGRESTFTFEVK